MPLWRCSKVSETKLHLEIATASLQGTERRHGQEAMAESVADAIDRNRHLIVQAGTGTGKTLGYLVPLLASGKRAVIATVTKALQDQLATKDLPHACSALSEVLGRHPTWSVLKGRNNYVCLQRLEELVGEGRLDLDQTDTTHVKRVAKWSQETVDGDLDSYPDELPPTVRGQVSVTTDECPGASRCAQGDRCFTERARARAEQSELVVVNTHLYGLDLLADGEILPDHEVVVIDEAHQLEDVLSGVASVTLSPRRVRQLASTVSTVIVDARIRGGLERAADRLASTLAPHLDKQVVIRENHDVPEILVEIRGLANDCLDALDRAEDAGANGNDSTKQRLIRANVETSRTIDAIDRILAAGKNQVLFVEGTKERPVLTLAPVEIGGLLKDALWSRRTTILTSATIPKNLTRRVGLDEEEVDSIDVGSPFDYAEQGILYCPTTIADPRSDTRDDEVTREIRRLIDIAGGRTMALFTTTRAMRHQAAKIADLVPYRVFVQDEMPRAALIRRFSDDETSCLFATAGFFQGVDIPGPTLSLVIIDKIPFPRPDDPLLEAKRQNVSGSAFAEIDLPRAATMLAQASGRLIRSRTDRGVVAILDPRLANKGYGRELIAALPGFRRTQKLDEVQDFLAGDLR